MAAHHPVQVAVTGAAGQIGYALLFRLAAGEVFGPDRPVVLRLLEVEAAMGALDGVLMELEDCAFPLLVDVVATSDPKLAFDGASWALLIGSVPRRPGMERGDLLRVNAAIFKTQGEAIAAAAAEDVRVLVVGNPCNTNCLIARSNAPDVPADRWFAMTRLDQNRARSLLAAKAGVPVSEVANVAIWGNHSATQYPDFRNATIGARPTVEVIDDLEWLQGEFITGVQQRGAAVLAARGTSSAASAASAAVDSVRSILHVTPPHDNAALAVVSRGEYGVPDGLQFGFPVRSDGGGWSVAEGFDHDEFAEQRLQATTEELLSERDGVADLLP